MPAAPPMGDAACDEPIRIVDPTGGAIAWVAHGPGAGCVGFAVRQPDSRGDRWVHLLPHDAAERGGAGRVGAAVSPILVLPEPRTDADAEEGAVRERALDWRFAGRDPTAVVLAADVAPGAPSVDPDGDAGGVRLLFTARLDDSMLWLALEADNAGAGPVAVRLGLRFRVAFASSPEMGTDGLAQGIPDGSPGAVVARGRTIDGVRVVVGAANGVCFAGHVAAPDRGVTPSVAVLGYRPPRGLVEMPPGGRAGVAGWIGLADG